MFFCSCVCVCAYWKPSEVTIIPSVIKWVFQCVRSPVWFRSWRQNTSRQGGIWSLVDEGEPCCLCPSSHLSQWGYPLSVSLPQSLRRPQPPPVLVTAHTDCFVSIRHAGIRWPRSGRAQRPDGGIPVRIHRPCPSRSWPCLLALYPQGLIRYLAYYVSPEYFIFEWKTGSKLHSRRVNHLSFCFYRWEKWGLDSVAAISVPVI